MIQYSKAINISYLQMSNNVLVRLMAENWICFCVQKDFGLFLRKRIFVFILQRSRKSTFVLMFSSALAFQFCQAKMIFASLPRVLA